MNNGDNLRKSIYPDCLLCLEKIFEKYHQAKGTISTQLIAQNLPPCPHKAINSSRHRKKFRSKKSPANSQV